MSKNASALGDMFSELKQQKQEREKKSQQTVTESSVTVVQQEIPQTKPVEKTPTVKNTNVNLPKIGQGNVVISESQASVEKERLTARKCYITTDEKARKLKMYAQAIGVSENQLFNMMVDQLLSSVTFVS